MLKFTQAAVYNQGPSDCIDRRWRGICEYSDASSAAGLNKKLFLASILISVAPLKTSQFDRNLAAVDFQPTPVWCCGRVVLPTPANVWCVECVWGASLMKIFIGFDNQYANPMRILSPVQLPSHRQTVAVSRWNIFSGPPDIYNGDGAWYQAHNFITEILQPVYLN